MSRNKIRLLRIAAGVLLFAAALISRGGVWQLRLGLFLACLMVSGADVILKALRNILRGQIFDENFLMSLAAVGAFVIGEYPEGAAVMLLYQIGELFQDMAVERSRGSIARLMDIRPDYANLIKDGALEKADPYDVAVGDLILIRPGEKVPLDAVVTEGESALDTSALTGESMPRDAYPGAELISGCVNLSGVLTARVSRPFGESTVSRILELVENASEKKAASESFITSFARWYTPCVTAVAALLAIVPPLIVPGAAFGDWVYRALAFLVVSCPCALVISVPLSFFSGIGAASGMGVLVKGANYLEALAKTEIAVFDKTGTLTKGVFSVQKIVPRGISEDVLLELAALAESFSSHPISVSIVKAFGGEIDRTRISSAKELAGRGVTALVDGRLIAAGNEKLMLELGITAGETGAQAGTLVHVAADGDYIGCILIADEPREDAREAVAALKRMGIRKTVMLTGDLKHIAESAAAGLGLDEVYAELLPPGKVERVEALLREKSEKGVLVFVGDGINDAPVLARADLGAAMGGLGSDAAIEAADIVIMTDEPSKLAKAIALSKKTLAIVYQNISFALAVKFIVLALAAAGIATMWAAVFADVGVSVLAILNAARVLSYGRGTR